MKKIFMAIALCLVCACNVFGQISITNTGSTRKNDPSYINGDMYGKIRLVDTIYTMIVSDSRSSQPLYIHIGSDKTIAINSLNALIDAFNGLKNKEYITFTDNGKEIVMFKWAGVPYFSDGTPDYVKTTLSRSVLNAFFGSSNTQSTSSFVTHRESDAKIGCFVSIKTLKDAVEILKKK